MTAYEELIASFTKSDPAYQIIADWLGISITSVLILVAIVSIWAIIWKGLAMWSSARKNHRIWFIVFLLIHTIGILEILYIYVFSKIGGKKQKGVKITSSKKK